MLKVKAQSHLAEALASMLRVQLRATNDLAAASMHGWWMWTQGLGQRGPCDTIQLGLLPVAPMWWAALCLGLWAPIARECAWNAGLADLGPRAGLSTTRTGLDTSFASYRSAGGHALAQVIVPTTEELAQATVRVAWSPLEAMLGVWRTALGV